MPTERRPDRVSRLAPPILLILGLLPATHAAAAEHVLAPDPADATLTTGDFTSIQAALGAAAAGDVITLMPGTYLANLSLPRRAITLRGAPGSAAAEVVLDGSACLRAEGEADCAVVLMDWRSAGGELPPGQPPATLQGLTLRGGLGRSYSYYGPAEDIHGGVLWMAAANPDLRDLVVEGGQATHGGGIYLDRGSPTLTDVVVRGNRATALGGGMFVRLANPTFTRVVVEGNQAGGDGGGLRLKSAGGRFEDVIIQGNESTLNGGGLLLDESSPTLAGVIVAENRADEDGGGIYLAASAPDLAGAELRGNSAGGFGGGAYLYQCYGAFADVLIARNSAAYGGGIALSLGEVTLEDLRILENFATARGGGMHAADTLVRMERLLLSGQRAVALGGGIWAEHSEVILSQSTLSGNVAQTGGGGMYLDTGAATLHNTVFAFNAAGEGPNLYAKHGDVTLGTGLWWHPTEGAGVALPDPEEPLLPLVADPRFFDDPTDGTQVDDDVHLRGGSPGLDAGEPTCWDAASGAFDLPCADPDGSAPDLGVFGGPGSAAVDLDGDGAPDDWEAAHGLDTQADGDADGDGLSDAEEFDLGTSPDQADTDHDGVGDAEELAAGSDPQRWACPPRGAPRVARVPEDFDRLQLALSAVGEGCIVEVGPGFYEGPFALGSDAPQLVSTGGPQVTILDGDSLGSTLTVTATPPSFRLSGFTLQGGLAQIGGGLLATDAQGRAEDLILRANSSTQSGGGVALIRSALDLIGLTVAGNHSNRLGGGLYLEESPVSLFTSVVEGNDVGVEGGGLYLYHSNATLSEVEVRGNRSGDDGAGLFLERSHPLISQVNVLDNHAQYRGGGIYCSDSNPTLSHVRLSGNQAVPSGGGLGAFDSTLTLGDVIIEGNAANKGGGLFLYWNSAAELNHVRITGNQAAISGGGLYAVTHSPPTLSNVILSHNRAAQGGAMYVDDSLSQPTLIQTTVTANEATERCGGICMQYGTFTAHNVIVALNDAPEDANLGCLTSSCGAALTASLFFAEDGSAGLGAVPMSAGEPLVAAPRFLDSAADDYRLRAPGSPAIDAGAPLCWDPSSGVIDLPCADPDGSAPDLGAWGGAGALGWDEDDDGAPAPWWPEDAQGEAAVAPDYVPSLADFDCDDGDPTLASGAEELPDGIDNDCDGIIDEEGGEPGGCDRGEGASGSWLLLWVGVAALRRRQGASPPWRGAR